MKRLLCILSNMNAGGAETFLMKIYRNIDLTKYQFDFIVSIKEKGFYDDEILKKGGKIYYIVPKSKNPLKSFFQLIRIVKKNQYKSVIRINEHSLAAIDLIAAKIGGAKKLIFRSSNSKAKGGKIQNGLHILFRFLVKIVPNVKLAPSTEAAIYTFGKKQVEKGKVKILNNAIPVNEFIFDERRRQNVRNNLNINNKIVIGHIGRFNKQKNHEFLIDIFSKLHENDKQKILLLVGTGDLQQQIKSKVENLKLEDSVIFLENRKDIPDLLMAMDIFVFPSFYEGMPNTVIEAQATGLKCIISDSITKESNITGLVEFINLEKGIDYWQTKIENELKNTERRDMSKVFEEKGYDIKNVADQFINYIF